MNNLSLTAHRLIINEAPEIRRFLVEIRPQLHLLPNSIDIEADDFLEAKKVNRELLLRRQIKPILPDFDDILIDTPPAMRAATVNALVVADGHPWTEPQVRDWIVDIVGQGAQMVRDDTARRFDVLPLLVATDGAIAAFGHDGRRLRPNIVIGGVGGLAERDWPGYFLRVRDVLIGVQDLRGRCVMTTFDPDTLEQNRQVLVDIVQKFGGELALNCYVIQGGKIRVDDPVELVER